MLAAAYRKASRSGCEHGHHGDPSGIVGSLDRLEGKACGIPHLAKNERDVGHPAWMRGWSAKR
jgi:hypothetical protein